MVARVGISYRPALHTEILRRRESLDFVEIVSDAFHWHQDSARTLSRLVPTTSHSLNLSIGTEASDDYLEIVSNVCAAASVSHHSDHLAFTRAGQMQAANFVPIMYNDDSLAHVVERVKSIQSVLNVPFALENIAAPFVWPNNTMTEEDYLAELVRRTGCRVLLDVENLRINSLNHGYSAEVFIETLPKDAVIEVHVAGGTVRAGLHVDTHDQPVPEPTWKLLAHAVGRFPDASILIEQDGPVDHIDDFMAQVERARAVCEESA